MDPDAARTELARTLAEQLPQAAVEVRPLTAERGYRVLYDDIDNDQRFFTIFALLILAGAAFAAFNLIGRIVEAQRREIGVGMSLGAPRSWLGLRPLLLALEVAVIGAAAGVAVGYVVGAAMGTVTESFFPMPVWERPFQVGPYLQATALGVGLVLAASIWPVLRAVRVPPIDAIRTGPRTTSRGGLAPLVQHLPLPGSVIATLPLRDVLRRPRRSVFTALGIAAAVATLVGVFGMIDSIYRTIDTGETELLARSPDRMTVSLQTFTPAGSPTLAAIEGTPGVGRSSQGLRIGGTIARPGVDLSSVDPLEDGSATGSKDSFPVLLDVVDLQDGVWTPTASQGSLASSTPALVLSSKAVSDLGVGVGDLVQFRHPLREGAGFRWVTSELPVGAIHPNPYRFLAFIDSSHADLMNLTGIVNQVEVEPAPGADPTELRRALFSLGGVGSVTPAAETIDSIRTTMDEFVGILQVIVWAVLLLAVLIAFNSSSISADERSREHATMFAFGLPIRTVLWLAVRRIGHHRGARDGHRGAGRYRPHVVARAGAVRRHRARPRARDRDRTRDLPDRRTPRRRRRVARADPDPAPAPPHGHPRHAPRRGVAGCRRRAGPTGVLTSSLRGARPRALCAELSPVPETIQKESGRWSLPSKMVPPTWPVAMHAPAGDWGCAWASADPVCSTWSLPSLQRSRPHSAVRRVVC